MGSENPYSFSRYESLNAGVGCNKVVPLFASGPKRRDTISYIVALFLLHQGTLFVTIALHSAKYFSYTRERNKDSPPKLSVTFAYNLWLSRSLALLYRAWL